MDFFFDDAVLFIDSNFAEEETRSVYFFYNIPTKYRSTYEKLYEGYLSYEDLKWIQNNKDVGDYYMTGITPYRFEFLRTTINDVDFHIFYEYYLLLQPVIKKIIKSSNLYEKYPEYII